MEGHFSFFFFTNSIKKRINNLVLYARHIVFIDKLFVKASLHLCTSV